MGLGLGMDKDEPTLMEKRVAMDGASEPVKVVARVKKEHRKELVEQLMGTMDAAEQVEFKKELKDKGVRWK